MHITWLLWLSGYLCDYGMISRFLTIKISLTIKIDLYHLLALHNHLAYILFWHFAQLCLCLLWQQHHVLYMGQNWTSHGTSVHSLPCQFLWKTPHGNGGRYVIITWPNWPGLSCMCWKTWEGLRMRLPNTAISQWIAVGPTRAHYTQKVTRHFWTTDNFTTNNIILLYSSSTCELLPDTSTVSLISSIPVPFVTYRYFTPSYNFTLHLSQHTTCCPTSSPHHLPAASAIQIWFHHMQVHSETLTQTLTPFCVGLCFTLTHHLDYFDINAHLIFLPFLSYSNSKGFTDTPSLPKSTTFVVGYSARLADLQISNFTSLVSTLPSRRLNYFEGPSLTCTVVAT